MPSLNGYLIVAEDKSDSYLYTSLKKAQEKSESMNDKCFVFEWIDTKGGCWGDPYQAQPNQDEDCKMIRDKNHFAWEMLKQAKDSGNWHGRLKYPANGMNK